MADSILDLFSKPRKDVPPTLSPPPEGVITLQFATETTVLPWSGQTVASAFAEGAGDLGFDPTRPVVYRSRGSTIAGQTVTEVGGLYQAATTHEMKG